MTESIEDIVWAFRNGKDIKKINIPIETLIERIIELEDQIEEIEINNEHAQEKTLKRLNYNESNIPRWHI